MSNKMYLHPITKDKMITKTEYFEILFGKDFMESPFKGTIQEYEDKKL